MVGWNDTIPGTERWQQQVLLGVWMDGLVRVVSLFQESVLSRGGQLIR